MAARKLKKSDVDKALLQDIFKMKNDWVSIQSILDRSVDASEMGQYDLQVAQAKYLFMLREARHRNLSALRA
ncbi:YaaL family protein [Terribacillus sp. DMT04]|uniref:YaaL family protein n=1 Tax=Terribacillus sp. DMT04 TaxID=2850441 RepID=UPI001C2C6313|nr:YaaL family protein [Terribacillus sp. DMT04]QXE01759.1 YaaL family protein [Terribacillus sp. DMT04]